MLNREVLTASEAVYNGCQEQPVDVDVSLPDYCPDIQKILKCQVCPAISSCSASGDHLEVEGTYTVRVFYLDSGGMVVRSYEMEDSFLSTISLKRTVENPRIYAYLKMEYVNCRATSPRRLDIHGAFSICARVYGACNVEAVSSVNEESVEELPQNLQYTTGSGCFRQPFTLEDNLELPQGKLPADRILRTQAVCFCKEKTPMADGLQISGEVRLKILYASAEESMPPETMEYTMPFDQEIACDSMTEDSLYSLEVSVSSVTVQVHTDYSGELTTFETHIRLTASVTCYEEQQKSILQDAYSRTCELTLTKKQQEIESLKQLFSDTCTHKFSIEGESPITKVLDLWNETCTVSGTVENGELKFSGKMNICVLAVNAENTPFYFERTTEFSLSKAFEGTGTIQCTAQVLLTDLSYHLTDAGIDLRAELAITAQLYEQKTINLITDAALDESKPKVLDHTAALSLYFASQEENLWSIARTYCSSLSAIRKENDLPEDATSASGMLLIPM